MYVGPAGVSGYAPWATWLEILIVVGGITAGVALYVWLSSHRKRRVARQQT